MPGNVQLHSLQQMERTIKKEHQKKLVFLFSLFAAVSPGVSIQACMALQWFGITALFFLNYWYGNDHFVIPQIPPVIMQYFINFIPFMPSTKFCQLLICTFPQSHPSFFLSMASFPKETLISLPLSCSYKKEEIISLPSTSSMNP